MVCYHCQHPGHMRTDCPRDRDPRVLGQRSPSQRWDRRGYSIFLHTSIQARGASISFRELHGTSSYTGRPKRPGYGPMQRTRPQAGTSGVKGVYAITPPTESADQPVIQGTSLLSRLWARVLFDSDVSHSFIAASVVIELGLEVEALEKPLYVSSPLGIRARIGMIFHGCKLEISGIQLTVDLMVMDMSEFDVILGMDWLTAYRVVIDCERRRVTAYTEESTRVVFQGDKHDILPQTVYESRCHAQLGGWLAILTLEDDVRLDLNIPRIVFKYEGVFPDELPGLPLQRVVDFDIELHPGTSPISMTPYRMTPVELHELRVHWTRGSLDRALHHGALRFYL